MPWILILAGIGTLVFAFKGASSGVGFGGRMTAARAHIHRHLMGNEMRSEKLEKAANLFASEGLHVHAEQLRDKARSIGDQMKAAVDLAKRARDGDQNAMAMIAACREQANAGNMRAFVTCKCIELFCVNNPMPAVAGDGPQEAAQVS